MFAEAEKTHTCYPAISSQSLITMYVPLSIYNYAKKINIIKKKIDAKIKRTGFRKHREQKRKYTSKGLFVIRELRIKIFY